MSRKVIGYGIRRMCSRSSLRSSGQKGEEKVYVAFGSNVGDRIQSIRDAIEKISHFGAVTNTSFLYESLPMYKMDQPNFLNGAVQFYTSKSPDDLLRALKKVETELGRNLGSERNSPRSIDLDIITYGDEFIRNDETNLQIPHPRLAERQFVLQPLCDIDPQISIPSSATSPGRSAMAAHLLQGLQEREGDAGLKRVTPVRSGRLLTWGGRTLLMGVLNLTSDSFSDGGHISSADDALRQADTFLSNGFDVIDDDVLIELTFMQLLTRVMDGGIQIGGQSTRPGAQLISAEEELQRVMPTIEEIVKRFPEAMISIDTFHSLVAAHALAAGAELVNDISAGKQDSKMHDTIARANAATIQMHTRGTAATMATQTDYDGAELGQAVGRELRTDIERAMDIGVARWSILADYGVGFAKTADQSRKILKQGLVFRDVVGGFPCVVGASRKSWMKGLVLGEGNEARDWGTAGAVGCAIALGGADMVRVHNVKVAEAVRACDGICKD